MRGLAFALVLALPVAAAAQSPTSNQASHIMPNQGGSTIAPRLPTPEVAQDNPVQYLAAARDALAAGRTGKAQEALERAETRLVSRSTPAFQTNEAAQGPVLDEIRKARMALGAGDRSQAQQLTEQALTALQRQ